MFNHFYMLSLSVGGWIAIFLAGAVVLSGIVLFAYFASAKLWFKAIFSGAHICSFKLLGMRLRKADVEYIVNSYIKLKTAGHRISLEELESFISAGGNVDKILKASIMAKDAGLSIPIATLKAIDLTGSDIVTRVSDIIMPRTIEAGDVTAIAKDGVALKLSSKVTVKGNVHRLIGVTDVDTILTRLEEAIATTVGSAMSYKVVVENPDLISKTAQKHNLDFETAYQVSSVEITNIEVLNNVGAEKEVEKAKHDADLAKAKKDEQIAKAMVEEQQKRAKVQDMRAKLLEAEAEIPKLMAKAIAEGKFGALDYFDLESAKSRLLEGTSLAKPKLEKVEPKILETESKAQVIKQASSRIFPRRNIKKTEV